MNRRICERSREGLTVYIIGLEGMDSQGIGTTDDGRDKVDDKDKEDVVDLAEDDVMPVGCTICDGKSANRVDHEETQGGVDNEIKDQFEDGEGGAKGSVAGVTIEDGLKIKIDKDGDKGVEEDVGEEEHEGEAGIGAKVDDLEDHDGIDSEAT